MIPWSKLCSEILLLLNIWHAGIDCLLCQRPWSVHLVRQHACREFCGVHSWQNDTRCRDGVKLLWCHSYLVGLVFEGSISLHVLVFIQKTFL